MNDEDTELIRLLPDPARDGLPGHRRQVLRQRFTSGFKGHACP